MTHWQNSKTLSNVLEGESSRHRKRTEKSSSNYLLAAVTLVLVFCVILLSLRCILKGHYETISEERQDFASEKTSRSESLESHHCSAVCSSKDCIKTAALMLNLMDTTVDPCDDFFSYACGGYDKAVRHNKKKEYVIKDLGEEVLKPLKDIIEKVPESVPEGEPGSSFAKLKKFYNSCMDLKASEEMAIPTALRYLEYFGIRGWPHLSPDYSFTEPDLVETFARLSSYNMFLFYSLRPDENGENIQTSNATAGGESNSNYTLKVLFTYSQIFHDDGYMSEYTKNSIKETLDYFEVSQIDSKQIIEDIISFDLGIANITKDTAQRTEQCSTNDTVGCSIYNYDCSEQDSRHVNKWCKVVKKVLADSGFMMKYRRIQIILDDGPHFKNLEELFERTSPRTIAHALALRFLIDNTVAMNFILRRKATYADFFSKPVENMPESPSTFCAVWVSKRLPILMGTAFYSIIIKDEIGKEVREIYADIQEALISIVENTPWLDREAKDAAKQLLSNITLSGNTYLNYVWNVSATDEFYARLQITDESFLANELEAKKFIISTAVRSLGNITEMEILTKSPFELEPTYGDEIINVEIGSYVFPLVATRRSRYSNLGYFGGIVGHELSHALEIFLRGYENKSENFEKTFEERTKCLSDHFSEYQIDLIGEKVNGSYTLGENLADYYGLRAVFKALRKYQGERGYVERLPGVHFDNEQILFVTFAQLWCETNTLDSLKRYIQDNHSPAKYRVWGIYRNFEPFSEAFSCPLGSPMNPISKCSFES